MWLSNVLVSMLLFLYTKAESSHHFTKLLAYNHMEIVGLYRNLRSPVECGDLCVQQRVAVPLSCEAYSFDSEEGLCELHGGVIVEASVPGKWVYRHDLYNASMYVVVEGPYYITPVRLNYYQAREYCQNLGLHLVHVDSPSFYSDLTSYIYAPGEPGKCYIIGVNDEDNEGVWTCDRHGTPVNASLLIFQPGEPNNYGGHEDCLIISSANMRLNDYPCTYTCSAICENKTTIKLD